MKQRNFLATVMVAAGMSLLFYSCNGSGEGDKTDEVKPDTTTTKAAEAPAVVKPSNFTLIKHKVANYAKWFPAYTADDSARLANGLNSYIIGRGIDGDSNTVLVAMKMADVDKARAMAASPGLKARMQQGGVVGMPAINFIESVWSDSSTNSVSVRLLITHKVKDWDAWKKEFDSHKQARMDAGLTDRVVGHEFGDNHTVTIAFAVTDMAKAKAFMASKDLKNKMAAAGVEGPPTMFFYNVVKRY
jgi:hypothetical protein